MAVFALLALSSAFCVIGWPEARIGLIVNAALLAALLALPRAGRPLTLSESANLPIFQSINSEARALASTIWQP